MSGVRGRFLAAIALVLAIVLAYWLSTATEWVDDVRWAEPAPEVMRDRHYAAKALVRRLGATVVAPKSLATLPPTGAVLVLGSAHWDIFPDRDLALQRWVRAGGRLLIDPPLIREVELPEWYPIRLEPLGPKEASLAAADRRRDGGSNACMPYVEDNSPEPAYGTARSYQLCGVSDHRLVGGPDTRWRLDDRFGARMLRSDFGQGSAAASSFLGLPLNRTITQGDNALAFAAALGLRRGDEVWFVDDEARTSLLPWLWGSGRAALLLALLAIGLVVWRLLPRFGPLRADPLPHRRSTAEQVRRTAAFIAAGVGAAALHAASRRALEDAAARGVVGFDRTAHVAERAAVIARAARVDPADLAAAMQPPGPRALAASLASLERARRLLIAGPPSSRPPPAETP